MLAGRVSSALALRGALAAAAAAPTAPPVRAWPMQLHRLALAAQRSSGITSTSGSDPESIVEGGRSGGTSYAAAAAPPRRQRLDDYVLSMHPEHSRNLVQSWIVQGKVLVNDKPVTKAGTPLPRGAVVRVTAAAPRYVCRAGLKLEAALAHFAVDVTGVTALDAGLSTGGFTDCMLQHGAHHVYGVDVGHGQVMGSIAQDPRVTVMEKTNLRHLAPSDLPEQVSLVTLDLSFISVLKVMPALAGVMAPGAQMLVLIKPQFEAGRAQVSSGGVVRDPQVHAAVVSRVTAGVQAYGLTCMGVMESPLKGDRAGNTEFLAHFRHDPAGGPIAVPPDDVRDEGGDGGLGQQASPRPRQPRASSRRRAA